MAFTIANWTCVSSSLNEGQETVTPFGGSPTVLNAPNIFFYGSPNDAVAAITTAGYFNSMVASLCVGDWIQGNGTDSSFSVRVAAITSGVVSVETTVVDSSIAPYTVSGNFLISPSTSGITAHAGGGQSGATPLTTPLNSVKFVASPGDSVLLPPAVAGMEVLVLNINDVNAIQVFATGSDQINLIAGNVGISQLPDTSILYTSVVSGFWTSSIVSVNFPTPTLLPSATGIVAHSGGGQGSATPLPAFINTVPTVAANGDSVLLPPSQVGLQVKVINTNATNYMEVFPNGTDTINLGAASAGVPQLPESTIVYTCTTLGNWITSIISSNYPVPTLFPYSASLTAHSGGGQSSALPLVSVINAITTVAADGDSVRLPPSLPGLRVQVTNLNVLHSVQVYGAGTDTINLVATGTGVPLLPDQTAVYTCATSGNWFSNYYPVNQIPVLIATVPLTAAQFNGMYAAPVQLVAAPGANLMIAVDKIVLQMTFGSADFASGGVVAAQYGATVHGAGTLATNGEAAADFFAAANTVFQFSGVSGNTVGALPTANVSNAGIFLSNLTGVFTTGDSTFVAKVYYKVVNLAGNF
jgi:hypothetical protein